MCYPIDGNARAKVVDAAEHQIDLLVPKSPVPSRHQRPSHVEFYPQQSLNTTEEKTHEHQVRT